MKKSKIWIVIIFNLLLLNCLVNYTVLADTEEEENYSEAYKKYLSLSQEEKDNIYVIPRKIYCSDA